MEHVLELLKSMQEEIRTNQVMAEVTRKKDKEDFLVKLEFNQEKANIMLAKLDVDRKAEKDEREANRKKTEDFLARLDANQEKADISHKELLAQLQDDRQAERRELKEMMEMMDVNQARTDLQFEELIERTEKTQRPTVSGSVSLCADKYTLGKPDEKL
ncbi:hypothetical protein B7P43_G08405 [Cryptotermes secundus]|uniref:Uncharacterized protein n=1 Tax=Cryptotermes secundus TaxID=105785 RepID=A0A2J7PXI7_9NEOP|nr:hypothetical protein B7P43_G08405 [Cryptotermes secundus]